MRAQGVSGVFTKSTDTDVVTAADQAVERQIRAALAAARPDDRCSARSTEPAPSSRAASDVRWILDPIDGTVNYLYGLPQYAVSLAAEVGGEVVAGVVRNAATGEEWTATRGGGAYREWAPPRAAPPRPGSAGPRGHRLRATTRPAGPTRRPWWPA